MLNRLAMSSPREFGKWCAFAVVLLTPGSFIVLPALWLARKLLQGQSR